MSYDYTQGQAESVEDLVIGGDVVLEHDADTTEALAEERQFFNLEPGTHTCVITGFITPKDKGPRKLVSLFMSGQERKVELYSVIVKFGEVSDPRHQVTDQFYLPPDNKTDLQWYNFGSPSTKPNSPAGFHAEKFGHFLNRVFGGFSKGQPIPPDARVLKNWVGRQVQLEVVAGKDDGRVDPSTGKPYPPRTQVKLYSYRSVGSGSTQYANGPQAGYHGDPSGRVPMGSVTASSPAAQQASYIPPTQPTRPSGQRPMPAGAKMI